MAWWDWGWEQQPQSWEWRSSSDWWSGEWRWQEEEDWRTARWWQEEEDKKAALAKRAAEQEAGVEAEGKGKKGEGKGEEGKKRKKKGRNNKNRALGSGTVSNVRRLEFQKKGLKASLNREREAQGLPPLESLEELLEAQKEGKKEEEEEEEEMEEEEEEKEQGERKKVTLVPAAARASEKQSQEATSSSSSTLLDTTLDKREKKKAKAPVEAAENRAVELKAALAERVAEGAKSKAPPPNLREAPSESPDEGAALAERAAPSDSGSGRNKGEKKKVEKKVEEEKAALAERAARRQKKFEESKTGLYLDDEDEDEKEEAGSVGAAGSASVPDHASMAASSAARSVGQAESLGKGPKSWQVKFPAALGKRVAIDFHNVLEVEGPDGFEVSKENIFAVQALRESGFWVCLLSYSGAEREQATRKTLKVLERTDNLVFDEMRFVRSHLGKRGKAQLCKTLAISDLFDDRDDILWEAQSLGVTDWAIRKRGQSHPGHKRAFDKLADAVEALLTARAKG